MLRNVTIRRRINRTATMGEKNAAKYYNQSKINCRDLMTGELEMSDSDLELIASASRSA